MPYIFFSVCMVNAATGLPLSSKCSQLYYYGIRTYVHIVHGSYFSLFFLLGQFQQTFTSQYIVHSTQKSNYIKEVRHTLIFSSCPTTPLFPLYQQRFSRWPHRISQKREKKKKKILSRPPLSLSHIGILSEKTGRKGVARQGQKGSSKKVFFSYSPISCLPLNTTFPCVGGSHDGSEMKTSSTTVVCTGYIAQMFPTYVWVTRGSWRIIKILVQYLCFFHLRW